MTSDHDPFSLLTSIRETGNYSSRNASKGAMLPEFYRLIIGLGRNYSKVKAKELIIVSNILNKHTYENRRVIWNRLNHRYFKINTDWIVSCIAQAAASGIESNDFMSLSYLYYGLRDRITFDFVTTVIWNQWQARLTPVSAGDFNEFLNISQETAPELKAWRETTRNRLGRNTLSALRDFGLLRGTAVKQIQRPTISSEAVYHLLAILWAEGKRGRAILEAEDWKLFLWNDTDTANALVRLAQFGWIKFERSGQTVILEMVRTPEVVLEGAHGE